ncbi:orange carotenoid protein N-terminal domain-containing protein [Moorena producens]|uniref:orange carotenoid protein N-terminal domain-containing protein n=1 Tax=Moorena producens TaxID=1155739 RepID=UPI0011EA62D0|nr:orange carotenoid protein N-terminal domain-containing protein [Moorena producens]
MEAIQSLSIDQQLGLLWVLYQNMRGLVTPLAPGATVQLKIEREIKTEIITT